MLYSKVRAMHEGTITIVCRNDLAEIERLRRKLVQFCELHDVSGRAVYAFNLALDEVLTNVIRHGYVDKTVREISVRVALSGDELSAVIEDDGREFNPVNFPRVNCALPLEDREPGGLGIHLVRSLVSRMEYKRDGDRNVLTIRKKVR